jgi:hypothetical protein
VFRCLVSAHLGWVFPSGFYQINRTLHKGTLSRWLTPQLLNRIHLWISRLSENTRTHTNTHVERWKLNVKKSTCNSNSFVCFSGCCSSLATQRGAVIEIFVVTNEKIASYSNVQRYCCTQGLDWDTQVEWQEDSGWRMIRCLPHAPLSAKAHLLTPDKTHRHTDTLTHWHTHNETHRYRHTTLRHRHETHRNAQTHTHTYTRDTHTRTEVHTRTHRCQTHRDTQTHTQTHRHIDT